jgi:hypothetical protein
MRKRSHPYAGMGSQFGDYTDQETGSTAASPHARERLFGTYASRGRYHQSQ